MYFTTHCTLLRTGGGAPPGSGPERGSPGPLLGLHSPDEVPEQRRGGIPAAHPQAEQQRLVVALRGHRLGQPTGPVLPGAPLPRRAQRHAHLPPPPSPASALSTCPTRP